VVVEAVVDIQTTAVAVVDIQTAVTAVVVVADGNILTSISLKRAFSSERSFCIQPV
jgi:hypothetical protein